MRQYLPVVVVSMLSGCTFGHVSTVPMRVEGVGLVWRYEGRANFGYQREEADRMMAAHCKKVNGGVPELVSAQDKDVGVIVTGGSNAVGATRNVNQELLFRCVKE